jgi:hypothetical protein
VNVTKGKEQLYHLTPRDRTYPANSQISRNGDDPNNPERERILSAVVPDYNREDDSTQVTHSAHDARDNAYVTVSLDL